MQWTAVDEAPAVGVEAAEFLLDCNEGPGVLDGGGDLGAVANDARIGGQPGDSGVGVARHLRRVKVTERLRVALALLEDGGPAESGLRALEREEFEVRAVVVNGVYPDRFRDDEIAAVEALDGNSPALRAAVATHRRARHHRNQVRRLRRRAPAITLPFLFETELGEADLESLADALERRLG